MKLLMSFEWDDMALLAMTHLPILLQAGGSFATKIAIPICPPEVFGTFFGWGQCGKDSHW